MRQPSERYVCPRANDGEGGLRCRDGSGGVPAQESERAGKSRHEEAIQQSRHSRLHHRRRHPNRMESEMACAAREVRPGIFHGIGLAAHSCSHGAGTNPATGQVIVNSDGSVQCVSACTEIGPGQRTEMAMITAEALGVPLSKVSIATYVDTDNTTDTGGTNGSRQTNTGGRGIYEAAIDAKKQILGY